MTKRRRKEISFLIWGVPGVMALLASGFAMFAGDEGPAFALVGLYVLFASLAGHALTCLAIDKFGRAD
jgi:hypothetical protein